MVKVYNEVFLEFAEDQTSVAEVQDRVSKTLEQYPLDEILDVNDVTEEEIVSLLYSEGYIGLPELIDNEDDEVPDLPDEED